MQLLHGSLGFLLLTSHFDCLQNRSLWVINGQLISTPLEALGLKGDVQSYYICSKHLILKVRVKALHSINDHPKCVALPPDIPQCLQHYCSFCRKANELSTLLPPKCQYWESTNHFPSPPWQVITSRKGRISTTVPCITGRADDTNLNCWCGLTTIASYQADYTIYSDAGLTNRRTRNRGAAAVVTRGSPTQPEVVTTIRCKGRMFTSSYEEEAAAMKSALSWTPTHKHHSSISIPFCTDTKSLCGAVISSNPHYFIFFKKLPLKDICLFYT